MSTAKSSSAVFSERIPLRWLSQSRTSQGIRFLSYPCITSSRTFSSPVCTSLTSTFLRQAFFPFLDGCLCCCGASFTVDILRIYFPVKDARSVKSTFQKCGKRNPRLLRKKVEDSGLCTPEYYCGANCSTSEHDYSLFVSVNAANTTKCFRLLEN